MTRAAEDDSARGLVGQVPLLADLLALPPLGQVGRQRYGPFLRAVLRLFSAQGATVGFWVSPHEIRRFRVR
ncbi:MAG TPA: hypothetical protein VKU85_20270, partial [bacterium]|nr:hypothetical protein [bacterium]